MLHVRQLETAPLNGALKDEKELATQRTMEKCSRQREQHMQRP